MAFDSKHIKVQGQVITPDSLLAKLLAKPANISTLNGWMDGKVEVGGVMKEGWEAWLRRALGAQKLRARALVSAAPRSAETQGRDPVTGK